MNWLKWKMEHGLAHRGRQRPMSPKGVVAWALYKLYYRRHDMKSDGGEENGERLPNGGRLFKVNVGGEVSPKGKMNGLG